MLDDLMGKLSSFLSKPLLEEDDEIDGIEEPVLESNLRDEFQRDMDVEVDALPHHLEEEMTASEFAQECSYEQSLDVKRVEYYSSTAQETLEDIAEELLEDTLQRKDEEKE